MITFNLIRFSTIFRWTLAVSVLIIPQLVQAQWQVSVGAESPNRGSQALAFLPNELWVHTGDSIRWTFSTHERHTLTFLKPGQTRPPGFGPIFGVPVGYNSNRLEGVMSFTPLERDGADCPEGQITDSLSSPFCKNFPLPRLVDSIL